MPTEVVTALVATGIFSTAVATLIVNSLISLAVSFVIRAATAKPSPRGVDQIYDVARLLTTLEPAAHWEIVYGQVRKGGKVVFRHTTSHQNGNTPLTHSTSIPLGASPTVTVPDPLTWSFDLRVETVVWNNEQESYDNGALTLVGSSPAAGQYSVAAGVYTFNEADGGKAIVIDYYDDSRTLISKYLHQVIVLAAHEVEEIGDIYFNDELVPLDGSGMATGKYQYHAYVSKHLGGASDPADAELMSYAPDKWTAEHRLRGHAYIYVRLLRNRELYPGGVPNVTAVVKGRKVFDPRSSLTAYSSNAALCINDYLTNTSYGLGADYATEVYETLLTASANVCDENVALAGGGTEDRYTCNGLFTTASKPQEVIEKLLTALSGRLVYVGGQWKLRAGAYITPAVTLDEGDARGPIRVTTRLSRRDTFNRVKGIYVAPENNWQPTDFPPVVNATYLSEDQGEEVWHDIELPFTNSPATAQRLAKIELERVRQQITVMMPCKLGAYLVEPPETVMLTLAKFGWTAKPFEVVESKLVFDKGALGVDLTLREIASTVFDWSSGEETEIDPAPDTNLPNPFAVGPPGMPLVTESLYVTRDGTSVRTRAAVTWADSEDSQADRYDLEWKLTTEPIRWEKAHGLLGVTFDIPDLPAGLHQFRVRAVSVLGVASAWSQVEREIVGLGAIPAAPSGVSLAAVGSHALISLTQHAELDVRRGGRILVRHCEDAAGATWETSLSIGNTDGYPGDSVVILVPLKAGTYLLKARDSTGQESVAATSVVTKQASVLAFAAVDNVDEAPTFPGTHSNTVVVSGSLELDVDGGGDVIAEGLYTFSAGFDFTTVTRVRITGHIESIVVNVNDTIDSRTALIDDWPDIDGAVGGGFCDAWLEARETDDNPAGSPVWSAWKRVDSAEFECRAMQFRLQMRSLDPAYNLNVAVLNVDADEVV